LVEKFLPQRLADFVEYYEGKSRIKHYIDRSENEFHSINDPEKKVLGYRTECLKPFFNSQFGILKSVEKFIKEMSESGNISEEVISF